MPARWRRRCGATRPARPARPAPARPGARGQSPHARRTSSSAALSAATHKQRRDRARGGVSSMHPWVSLRVSFLSVRSRSAIPNSVRFLPRGRPNSRVTSRNLGHSRGELSRPRRSLSQVIPDRRRTGEPEVPLARQGLRKGRPRLGRRAGPWCERANAARCLSPSP